MTYDDHKLATPPEYDEAEPVCAKCGVQFRDLALVRGRWLCGRCAQASKKNRKKGDKR